MSPKVERKECQISNSWFHCLKKEIYIFSRHFAGKTLNENICFHDLILTVCVSPFLSPYQCLEDCEKQHFFEVVLPAMVDLALSAPVLCTMASILFIFVAFVYSWWWWNATQDGLMSYSYLIMNGPFESTWRPASLEVGAERGAVCLMSSHPSDVLHLWNVKVCLFPGTFHTHHYYCGQRMLKTPFDFTLSNLRGP